MTTREELQKKRDEIETRRIEIAKELETYRMEVPWRSGPGEKVKFQKDIIGDLTREEKWLEAEANNINARLAREK